MQPLAQPPKDEFYPVRGSSAVTPWQWLKWFEVLRAGLSTWIAEYSRSVTSVSANTTLDDTHATLVVTADGKTITLPAASTARIGKKWTVIFAATGSCVIECAGSDTFPAVSSATETSLTLTDRGAAATFQCTSASTWGLV